MERVYRYYETALTECTWILVLGKLPPPMNIPPMKAPPFENYRPPPSHQEFTPEKIDPYEKSPPEKITSIAWNPLPTYKSHKWKKKQNYKISCLQESCATQYPYQNNQGFRWYTDDLTENTGLRYFLYRMKKIQKSNESATHQMTFTCQLYKSSRTKTRQSNYKIWQICETTK